MGNEARNRVIKASNIIELWYYKIKKKRIKWKL